MSRKKTGRGRGSPSESFPLEYQQWRLAKWPARDRAAFLRAIATPNDPFAKPGPIAGLADRSKAAREKAWGNFLATLAARGRLDPEARPEERPEERATHENITDWITTLRARLTANSASRMVVELTSAIKAMVPEKDWRWIRRHPLRPSTAEARASRKPVEHFDPATLVEGLVAQCAALDQGPPNRHAAADFRDAVMVILAVYVPIRSSNLNALIIGRHLVPMAGTFRLDVPIEETKTGKPVSVILQAEMAHLLRRYLDRYRPVLIGAGNNTERLWIGIRGEPLKPTATYDIFRKVGRSHGIALRPHLVRHTAATLLLTRDPTDMGTPSALLTHKGARTINEAYDRSGNLGAIKTWQQLRRKLGRSE